MPRGKADTTPARLKGKTRGQRIIIWIEVNCRVPEGKDVGKPVRLRKWQRREILRIYDNKHGTRRAIVSFGRKNGKTALAAFLLLVHLVGPASRPNSQLYSAAQSRDQAALLFNLAAKVVRQSPTLYPFILIRDTRKELYSEGRGTLYRALSADAATAYGLSPVFIVHDELGQVRGPRSELYEALETATGAQEEPLSIIISTQAPTDNDLLSVLIDDAKTGQDKRVVLSLYTAPPEADPFCVKTIKRANPAFGDFQNASEVKAMAEDARRMPSREAEYRNLVLNQRVERLAPFLTKSVYMACAGPTLQLKDFAGKPVYAGLDLSEITDLCSLVLLGLHEERWHVRPFFWLPEEGLAERSRSDRVQYDVWHKQGALETTPGKTVEYRWVAMRLRRLFDDLDIRGLAFDRWNFRHLKPWLLEAGFTEKEIEEKFVEFGQGFASMSPAITELEAAFLNDRIRHDVNPVMTMCQENAVVIRDPAGNRKLDKSQRKRRIDGMVALVMAKAMAATHVVPPPRQFQVMIFGARA